VEFFISHFPVIFSVAAIRKNPRGEGMGDTEVTLIPFDSAIRCRYDAINYRIMRTNGSLVTGCHIFFLSLVAGSKRKSYAPTK
jgi:hypothetical protein